MVRSISRITQTAHANRVLNRVPYSTVRFVCAVPYSMAWAFLSFGVPPLVNGSDAELKLLLPEHREKKKIGATEDLLVEVLVVMLVVVVLVMLPMLMVIMFVVFVIFGFRKNIVDDR